MSNREKLHEWIDRYNNKDLTGDELVIFLELMNNDHRIREEVRLDEELNSALKEIEILDLRKKIRKISAGKQVKRTHGKQIILMAATLLILLSVEGLIFYLTHAADNNRNPEIVIKKRPSLEKYGEPGQSQWTLNTGQQVFPVFRDDKTLSSAMESQDTILSYRLLASYQPNKAMENLIGTTSRSGNFRMLKPPGSPAFSRNSTILFSWKTAISEETSLVVENNTGRIVYESVSNFNQSVYLKTNFLEPGLYYYKVMSKDEVFWFGKFMVQ